MNLKFWKKKTGAGEETAQGNLAVNAKPRESLDFVAAEQGSAGQNPEPAGHELSGADETSPETSAKPGPVERMKLLLGGLTRHFKRTPTFRAEVEPEAPEDEFHEGEPARSRKRLIIGGVVAAVVLLLIGIGIALWPSAEQPPQKQSAPHDVAAPPDAAPPDAATPDDATPDDATPSAAQPAAAPQPPPNEIEALRKENAELQAKIEELKKGQAQQRPTAAPARQTGASTPLSSVGGEMAVGSSDPKAAAMTLKEAIDAMNASSGDYRKKPAK
ncbi:hypothetical protein [Candidatus Ferrigenium straubiae]|jgi:hypothetical protein|uniref:hypothetical protein n=1 Tax=Candidatus Ferrigenium straubiae TaxID=2919506 RepID=UPI003F4ABD13